MVICADTSFLFSLYANDVHTAKALAWTQTSRLPITVSEVTEFELGNALRFAEFRGLLARGHAAMFWAQYEKDCSGGRIILEICNLASVIAESKRLSATHTLTGGHRGFDILHLGAALELGADRFLTFDANQKRLAQAEGLTVPI